MNITARCADDNYNHAATTTAFSTVVHGVSTGCQSPPWTPLKFYFNSSSSISERGPQDRTQTNESNQVTTGKNSCRRPASIIVVEQEGFEIVGIGADRPVPSSGVVRI